jgi:hypothetical protein
MLLVAAVSCEAETHMATSLSAAPTSAATDMGVKASPGALAGASGTLSANAVVPARASAGVPAAQTSGASGAPHVGSAGMTAAGSGATSSSAPTLTEIYSKIYTLSCAACHSMAPSDNQNGMLGMIRSKDQLYAALVDKPAQGSQCMGKGTYIVPGHPETSLLIQKLSTKPPCGVSMPLGGMSQPHMLELLSAWIAAGALNN